MEAYESGVARVTGYVYTVDTVKSAFFRRPDKRTRILLISSGDLIVNVILAEVNIDKIVYKLEKKSVESSIAATGIWTSVNSRGADRLGRISFLKVRI